MSNEVERVYPRLLDFVRKKYVSKNLLRVTLTGEDLIGFPEDQNGSHIKVFSLIKRVAYSSYRFVRVIKSFGQSINRFRERIPLDNTEHRAMSLISILLCMEKEHRVVDGR